ncbi:AfsR/SARP family transcriptional regulator [Speluncibacter jeojiensis]|uniref:AfsR/SARP family transcriptional regulator n=1 Tax=Speluncibacter jeojiensis TaxID=2710754 RepID=UPI00240FCDCF|nr:BTAD domain-containing putative transcriptional regulator [Rhodococcus sp. D2-41]
MNETEAPVTTPQRSQAQVGVGLLGPVSVRRGDDLAAVAGGRARSMLVALALEPGRTRSPQRLIEDVWGDEPPRAPTNALHTQISRLRALLPAGALEAGPAGYRLRLPRDETDLSRAQDLLIRARADGDPAAARACAQEALRLWRGDPAADLPPGALSDELRRVADGLRGELERVRLDADLAEGRFADAVPVLTALCANDPLDERSHSDLMRALAGLGRGNEAVAVFAALRGRLAERLGTDPSAALVELHTAILRGEVPAQVQPSAPVVAAAAVPSRDRGAPDQAADRAGRTVGLRAAPNALLGRDDDIAALQLLMARSRVTTILGPGGTGKTRMAHELGTRAAVDMPVALVELAGVRNGEDVVAAISATLGIGEAELSSDGLLRTRIRDIRERLRGALSARPTLLILDNCEHVIDACADIVDDLVGSADRLTVLTTSRTPLMIGAESVYPLTPLAVDEEGSPATELFCARSRAVRPAVHLDRAAVARLCRTLDGLPLAIELAAARVRTMTVEEINTRLVDRFALLRNVDRGSPERHRTLHAVIDWSWDLLADDQRAALRRLCRFPDGFTRDAAAAVAGWGEVADPDLALEGLVNQSLLAVEETAVGLRYRMLETVREFGEEQLAAGGESAEVDRRQLDWAVSFARNLFELGWSRDQVRVVTLMESEHEALLTALRRAVGAADGAAALTLFGVLGLYWSTRGAHSEIFTWAGRVLDLTGDPAVENVAPDVRAMAYALAGIHLWVGPRRHRHLGTVRMRLRRLLASDAGSGLRPVVRLFADAIMLDAYGAGLGRLLAHGVRSKDIETRCAAYVLRANTHENAGNRRASWRDASTALELARVSGNRWVEGMSAQLLGGLHSQAARYAEAVDYFYDSVTILRELHAYEESSQVRAFVAAALVGVGQTETGRSEAEAALGHSAVGPVPAAGPGRADYEPAATAALAEADLAEGETESGLALYRRAVEMSRPEDGADFDHPYAGLLTSAAVCACVQAGELVEARRLCDAMLEVAMPRLGATRSRRFVDQPVAGAMAVAVCAIDLAEGRADRQVLRLLAIAVRAGARQDYPALRHDRQLARAREITGDGQVDAALEWAASQPRRQVSSDLVQLLVERYERSPGAE